jgi:6-phosphogluconate dehydrogenase
MQLGMIGLGRMGGNMVRRLLRAGHECVGYAKEQASLDALVSEGMTGSTGLAGFVAMLRPPRAVWLMIPAGAVDEVIGLLIPHLSAGDIVIDGGNSYYKDDIVRAERLAGRGIHYLDVGTSGGVWGLDRGYCLMIGGEPEAVRHLTPVFRTLAPGLGETARTPGRAGEAAPAEEGWLHCGPAGAGHFVKMVHNGVEYGLMAAYAEGFNLLRHAGVGRQGRALDAETTPLRNPGEFQYDIDVAAVAELWRRGSVVASWLLDLSAVALLDDSGLKGFSGRVSDSGEGRWTSIAAIESGCPAPVLTTALFSRFDSREEGGYANRLLSALRYQFGGHHEKKE